MIEYSFMKNALIVGALISILCPCIGIFLVLRRHSMIGDALSHASFAGVSIGVLLNINPIISAFIFTCICGVLIEFLKSFYKRYEELILIIVLTLSVGIAITIMSITSNGATINAFLFGSILTVSDKDLFIISILSIFALITLILLYNKLIYITFDEDGAKVAKIKVKRINYLFSIITCTVISISIRILGILVLASMIAIPVASALQFEKGFNKTLALSIFFAFIDIMFGLILSYYIDCAPGGSIALNSIFVLVISMILKHIIFKKKPK